MPITPKPPPYRRIRQFREELGISQLQLADKVGDGWYAHHIRRLENGDRDPLGIKLRSALAICRALGKTLDEVFG